jgi:hypothetical protein
MHMGLVLSHIRPCAACKLPWDKMDAENWVVEPYK